MAGLESVELFHEMAGPSWYLRIDVHVERAAYPATKRHLLVGLADEPPPDLAGEPVVRTLALETADGFKFWLGRRGVAAHPDSGTEPLVRVYVEATTETLRTPSWEQVKGWCVAHDDRRGRTAPSPEAMGRRARSGSKT